MTAKRIFPIILLGLLAVLLTPLSATRASAADAPTATGGAGDLYLAQATSGELSGSKLVLHGIAPRVTTFTDRPLRSASSVATAHFVRSWKSAFGDDPPNAALEVAGAPRGRDVAVVELRNPRFDLRHHTLTFSVKRLKQSSDAALRSFDVRADGSAVHEFGRASLFIDSGFPPATPVLFRVKVATGQTVGVQFAEPIVPGALTISGIMTPPANNQYPVPTGAGTITIRGGSFSLTTTNGPFDAEFVLIAESPPTSPVTGTASVPTGSSLEMIVNGAGQEVATGKFSVGG